MSVRILMLRLRGGALLVALAAAVAAAAAQTAGAAEIVNWPWSLTRIIRAPFDLPFTDIGGITVSPDGEHLFVGNAGVIDEYSATGVWEQIWAARFNHISGMASDPSGNLYVADSGSGQVQKFDETGKPLATWSVPGVRGIAVDSHAHVYLLVSVGLGEVVDVRSYTGVDEGAWSAVLPGSWFPPGPSSYSTATTAGITGIATDTAGDVYLSGISRQRLEGSGPDCHSVFDVSKLYEFAYDDPLDTNEVAEYTPGGAALHYEFSTAGAAACYPGWHTANAPASALAVSPADSSAWISEDIGYIESLALGGTRFPREQLYSPCYTCEGVDEWPTNFEGPALFDCHNNLWVGSGARVFEFVTTAPTACPPRPSRFAALTFASTLEVTPLKPKKGKGKGSKALDFEVGCSAHGCPIRVTAALRLPRCRRGGCLHVLASHNFDVAGGKLAGLSLPLGAAGGALRTRPAILLSARLLRNGHPYGRTFRAGGGHPLLALASVPLTVSCPASAPLGGQIPVSGALGLKGVHALSVEVFGRGPLATQSLKTTAAGTFALTVPASPAGAVGLAVSFAGDHTHSPAGAECATVVTGPPPPPLPPPPIVKEPLKEPLPEPPKEVPVETKLALTCRPPAGGEFTGTLTPPLGGAPVTISYSFKFGSGPEEHLEDTVTTNATGGFHDPGPPGGVTGTAKASWPGKSGYAGSSSETCSFP